MILPLMDLLMDKRANDLAIGALQERGRVERYLINDLIAAALAKSAEAIEPFSATLALQGDQAIRQGTIE